MYIKEIALAVICPLTVNLTPLDAFQLPPTCEYIDKIVCVSTDQCGVDVVTVDKMLEKCISTDANYVCTITTVYFGPTERDFLTIIFDRSDLSLLSYDDLQSQQACGCTSLTALQKR